VIRTVLGLIGNEVLLADFLSGLSTIVLVIVIAACVVLLSKGADWMIEGVVHLAERTGLPRILIGATVISLGTTAPEAFVSVMAAFMGNPGLALGNGVGSIIADTGLIFGLTCLVARVPVRRDILNRTGWVQVGAATLLAAIAMAKLMAAPPAPVLGRGVGILFLCLLAGYLFVSYRWAVSGVSDAGADGAGASDGSPANGSAGNEMSLPACWAWIVTGLFMVVAAARILVPAASEIAMRLGVPDDVIAATMVAFGTSLPELVTAVTAIRKGYPEITVGNIVGADVLNCLFVVGAAATARPLTIEPNFYRLHFPVMLIVLWSLRGFISFNRSQHFKRWQGAWLTGVYVVYIALQYI